MALPLLMPLPAGDTSIVSPAPSVAVPSATPVPSVGTSPTPAASASSRASAAPTPTATARTYVVKRGDQLGRIAASFGVTLQALQAANGIANPNLIFAGQKLVIPPPSASPGASPSASPSAAP
jgi:LysM repeat protein